MDDALVEKVARAIASVTSLGGTLCEGEQPEDNWEAWESEARAAIAALTPIVSGEELVAFLQGHAINCEAENLPKVAKRFRAAAARIQQDAVRIERLREALERIRDRSQKLRKGTDDWFELVQFEALAVEALASIDVGR